eukprot:61613_1
MHQKTFKPSTNSTKASKKDKGDKNDAFKSTNEAITNELTLKILDILSGKTAKPFNPNTSKLTSSMTFTSPPHNIVHTTINNNNNNKKGDEGVFFEAVFKSI